VGQSPAYRRRLDGGGKGGRGRSDGGGACRDGRNPQEGLASSFKRSALTAGHSMRGLPRPPASATGERRRGRSVDGRRGCRVGGGTEVRAREGGATSAISLARAPHGTCHHARSPPCGATPRRSSRSAQDASAGGGRQRIRRRVVVMTALPSRGMVWSPRQEAKRAVQYSTATRIATAPKALFAYKTAAVEHCRAATDESKVRTQWSGRVLFG